MDDSPASSNLHQLAIEAALDSRWDDALKINKQIIKSDPKNVDAFNRLARAHFELGNLNMAKKYYSLALKSDPYNPIALKNLKIIKTCLTGRHTNGAELNVINVATPQNHNGNMVRRISSSLFLQEPGKTKVVGLLKVAEPQKLSRAYCGMPVEMVIKNHKVVVVDNFGAYLGVLPDDLCRLMARLLRGGNKYSVWVKAVKVNGLSVLIKEMYRSKRFKNQPSFLEANANTYTGPDLISQFDDQDNEDEEFMDQEPEAES